MLHKSPGHNSTSLWSHKTVFLSEDKNNNQVEQFIVTWSVISSHNDMRKVNLRVFVFSSMKRLSEIRCFEIVLRHCLLSWPMIVVNVDCWNKIKNKRKINDRKRNHSRNKLTSNEHWAWLSILLKRKLSSEKFTF